MARLEIRDVVKKYGALQVLHNVNVRIADGQFVALVGPSGCGKSTLLRMIAGLESIDGGEIFIGDRCINDIRPQDRNVAMVFQNYALYPHMTVRENMAFSLKFRKHSAESIAERIEQVAKSVRMEAYLDRYPRELSGGQRQRVAMGRAIVRHPEAFLFDEPLSNLDASLRVQMRKEIIALHQRIGTSTVYVTHDQVEAMTMSDVVVVMRDGHVEQVADPLELYDNPANRFVAGFIGSPAMNFINGTIDSENVSVFRTSEGTPIDVFATECRANERVVLGIRPDHIEIAADSEIKMTVNVVEATGSQTQIYGDLNGQEICVLLRERFAPEPGDVVGIRPRPGSTYLFEEVSGERIRCMDSHEDAVKISAS